MSRAHQLAVMRARREAAMADARRVIEAQRAAEIAAREPITTPIADAFELAHPTKLATIRLLRDMEVRVQTRTHRPTMHEDFEENMPW